MKKLGLINVAVALLLAVAFPASATADRAEYAAQANQLCAAENTQVETMTSSLSRKLRKLQQGANSFKKWNRINAKAERLTRRFNRQYVAVISSFLEQLAAIPPAAGDEQLVTSWIAVRRENVEVYRRLAKLGYGGAYSVGVVAKRRDKKARRRERRRQAEVNRLVRRSLALYELDVEYASALGAAYCVTGATGST